MSQPVAIITFMEHSAPTDRGRMSHALNLASELQAAGREFKLIFAGKSVEWLPELFGERADQHPFVRNYGDHFDRVRSHVEACNFCCVRFGVRDQVEAADIPIKGEGKGHMHVSEYVLAGWQVITF